MTETLRCLFDDQHGAEGGRAEVHWLEGSTPAEVIHRATQSLTDLPGASCVSIFVAGEDSRFIAESFSPSNSRIRFCGHGALAAARVVFDRFESFAVEFSSQDHRWLAQREADGSDFIKLTYDKPIVRFCEVPEYASAVLGKTPEHAAHAGSDTDYLILELPEAEWIENLLPDMQALESATQRALIVTAAKGNEPGCVYRYFAPQYGTPEDPATGSAAVQLGAYWRMRKHWDSFFAHQVSQQGAMMELSCSADAVALRARVSYG